MRVIPRMAFQQPPLPSFLTPRLPYNTIGVLLRRAICTPTRSERQTGGFFFCWLVGVLECSILFGLSSNDLGISGGGTRDLFSRIIVFNPFYRVMLVVLGEDSELNGFIISIVEMSLD